MRESEFAPEDMKANISPLCTLATQLGTLSLTWYNTHIYTFGDTDMQHDHPADHIWHCPPAYADSGVRLPFSQMPRELITFVLENGYAHTHMPVMTASEKESWIQSEVDLATGDIDRELGEL